MDITLLYFIHYTILFMLKINLDTEYDVLYNIIISYFDRLVTGGHIMDITLLYFIHYTILFMLKITLDAEYEKPLQPFL